MSHGNKHTMGIIYLRWNHYNRIAVAAVFYREQRMYRTIIDYGKIEKVIKDFIPETSLEFVSFAMEAFKRLELSAGSYQREVINQNGLLEIHSLKPFAHCIEGKKTRPQQLALIYGITDTPMVPIQKITKDKFRKNQRY